MYGNVTCRRAVTASWSLKSATAMWLDVSTLMNINVSDKKSTTIRVTDATVTAGTGRVAQAESRNDRGNNSKQRVYILCTSCQYKYVQVVHIKVLTRMIGDVRKRHPTAKIQA